MCCGGTVAMIDQAAPSSPRRLDSSRTQATSRAEGLPIGHRGAGRTGGEYVGDELRGIDLRDAESGAGGAGALAAG